MKTYYFDYNATTPLAPEVLEAMMPFLTDHFANASSVHQLGRVPARALKDARRKTAQFLGASSDDEIIFTSGGTESNNAAIQSALSLVPGRKRILSTRVEHSSILRVLLQLEKEGYILDWLEVDRNGALDLGEVESKITEDTALVTLMMANNETGVLFPVEWIAQKAKQKGAFIHVDGVQAAGKMNLNLKDTLIDFFSISGHKFYGPKGAGALYIRKGISFQPHIRGGAQERGRRAGTENVAAIAGLGRAAELSLQRFAQGHNPVLELRDEFETRLLRDIAGVSLNGASSDRLCNTTSACFEGLEAETILMALDQQGICASSGSACMSGSNEPSHVLKAMGFSDDEARSAVRFSFGFLTTREEIDFLLKSLQETVRHLRSFVPDAAVSLSSSGMTGGSILKTKVS